MDIKNYGMSIISHRIREYIDVFIEKNYYGIGMQSLKIFIFDNVGTLG